MNFPALATNLPPEWESVSALFDDGRSPFHLGFHAKCPRADVNRFRARYRVARAFRGLSLEGFGEETVRGYDALTSVAFAWSALEQLARIYGEKYPSGVATRIHDAQFLAAVRAQKEHEAFIRIAASYLDQEFLRKEIASFLEGRDCVALSIPGLIRHIFLHGPLTPGAGKIEDGGETVVAICEASRSFILDVIDSSWLERLTAAGVIKKS